MGLFVEGPTFKIYIAEDEFFAMDMSYCFIGLFFVLLALLVPTKKY